MDTELEDVFETPDLWEELQRSREVIVEIQRDSGNAPFTRNEQKQIGARLQVVKEHAKEQFTLSDDQVDRIAEGLDEVVEAGTRMGRKDWLIYFLGTITALTITATVPAGVGEQISVTVLHGIIHLFSGGSEPPRILT